MTPRIMAILADKIVFSMRKKNRFAGIKMGSISHFKKSFFTCLFLDLKSFLTKELSKATHKKHYLSRQ